MNHEVYGPAARRWADSYIENPPGESDHELYVILNGGNGHGPYQHNAVRPLPVVWTEHNNWAKDIGAFITFAETTNADLLVCFGAHVHHHKTGWLDRIVKAVQDYGPGIYGAFAFHHPTPHIRTTAFAISPELLRAYPHPVNDRTRYSFEHSQDSITLWIQKMGFATLQVTNHGVFDMPDWHHCGRDECLLLDQHTDRAGF